MNMFRIVAETFGPAERRAFRRGLIWGTVAFVPIFAFWTSMGSPRAGAIDGAIFAWLAFAPGLVSGLMDSQRRPNGTA
jgi:hypothetical protein